MGKPWEKEKEKKLHVHVSALNALIVLAYLIILGFIIRTIQAKYPDNELVKATAFIW